MFLHLLRPKFSRRLPIFFFGFAAASLEIMSGNPEFPSTTAASHFRRTTLANKQMEVVCEFLAMARQHAAWRPVQVMFFFFSCLCFFPFLLLCQRFSPMFPSGGTDIVSNEQRTKRLTFFISC